MQLRINYFAKPLRPDAAPALLAYPTGDFDTVEEARLIAFADADNPKIGTAHSIIIESADTGTINERWVRDGDHWKREDA